MTSKSHKMRNSFNNASKVAVPGIGFATTLSSGDIRIDYKDGSSLTVSCYVVLISILSNIYS